MFIKFAEEERVEYKKTALHKIKVYLKLTVKVDVSNRSVAFNSKKNSSSSQASNSNLFRKKKKLYGVKKL